MRGRGLLLRHLHVPLSIALAVLSVGLVAGGLLRQHSYSQAVASLTQSARLAQQIVLAAPADGIDAACKAMGSHELRITVIRLDGVVLGDSEARLEQMENHLDREEFLAARQGRTGIAVRSSASVGRPMLYLALPAVQAGAARIVVRASTAERPLRMEVRGLGGRIALAGIIILAVLTLVTVLIENRRRGPLLALQRAAAALASGELDRRLTLLRPPDLRALAESLNEMAASLRDRVAEITSQKNELAAILEGMVEGVVVLDAALAVRAINPAALRFSGLGIAQVQGASILEVFRSTRLADLARRALSCPTPVEETLRLEAAQAVVVNAQAVQLPEQNARVVLVLYDVTRMEALETVRRDFVANVSHELNTPVTAVKGALATLRAGALEEDPEAARRFLDVAARHTDRLVSLIEDLMSVARLEKLERDTLEKRPCALEAILRSAAAICAEKASARRIQIVVSAEPDLQATVNPPLLEQALVNLIDNAVEYSSPDSRVDVGARSSPDGGVTLSVRDRGIGIPPLDLPRVFERFYRVDKGRNREAGGTGLGLAIVKHVALAHGGTVNVQSLPGEGSTFSISLPAPDYQKTHDPLTKR